MTSIQFVSSEDGDLAVHIDGDGAPLVLVSGFLQSAGTWELAGYLPRLTDHCTVIRVDPLGHGLSAKPYDEDRYRPERLVAHLDAVLDHLDLADVHLWGFSRGATIAAWYAQARPQRTRSLVFGGNALGDLAAAVADMGMDLAEIYRAIADALAAGDWEAFWAVFPVSVDDELRRRAEAANDPVALSAVLRSAIQHPFVFEVPDVPTLAIWGDGEGFHPHNLQIALDVGDALRHATVPGGHGESFADSAGMCDAVIPFLRDVDRGAPSGRGR